jgi:isoamylase
MLQSGWRTSPGLPYPLGATVTPEGINFALHSRGAQRAVLCLFDDPHGPERARIQLLARTGYVWHGLVHGLKSGQLYGYRVYGNYDSVAGQRFNPAKLLIDPYARALAGAIDWTAPPGALVDDGAPSPADNSSAVPKSVAWTDDFDWRGDAPPGTAWRDTVLYETHVKGFSIRHPEVPVEQRGTFLGLASEPAIEHFSRLGITALELMPVAAVVDSERLHRQGLTNYWGYDPIAFFAPDARLSSSGDRGQQVTEFKTMVRELHRNGIEVILDVVCNHTAESFEKGPTLSMRGIDNATYYRLDPVNPAHYLNFTGTGNTLNLHERPVLRLVLDNLRYWVQEMHVDGFRLDLATVLARDALDFDERSSFLDAVYQDPILSRVKLIAEPWDLAPGGYQAGRFPAPFSEWNDWFRDDVRRYWRGDEGHALRLARRLTASPDRYAAGERDTSASINYVTSHDGYTLNDLVSYKDKHNLANGENNRDGPADGYSHNFGVEGASSDPQVAAARAQQQRNLLATLLFSQGVPMLLGGDEIGRTQAGNNNAFNQDNPTSWYDWALDRSRCDLLRFTSRLIAIRRAHPALSQTRFLTGGPDEGAFNDLRWLREDGHDMAAGDWADPWRRCFGMLIAAGSKDSDDKHAPDGPLLLLLNASDRAIDFSMPPGQWSLAVDTARPDVPEDTESYAARRPYTVSPRSMTLLAGDRSLTRSST